MENNMKKLCLVIFALFTANVFAENDSIPASTGSFKIDSIKYDIGDAFDDSKYHTKYDKWAYDFLNWIHIETRESVIRKLLLFNVGDEIDSIKIQESERFLRTQNYLSDAKITLENENGKNIANVHTSDNWTLAIPVGLGFGGKEWAYKNLNWSIGIQESNFLGLGQKLGFYFAHDYYRDIWSVEYSDPHFLFRYNHLDVTASLNSDGYLVSWQMYVPFLSRSQNQWAYTLAGLKSEKSIYMYGSGDLPEGAMPTTHKKPVDSLPHYNGKNSVLLMKVEDFIDDSLSFRMTRSFGGTFRKFYVGATYDYRRLTGDYGKLNRYVFVDNNEKYAIDSTIAWEKWIPERKDSRLGFYLQLSNLHYTKANNLHNVKWTEDVEKGYSVKAQLSKNYEQIGSDNNDIRIDLWANLYLGSGIHHLTLKSESRFYLDHGEQRDFYGKVFGEYIFHPTNKLSTVLKGQVDFYDNARLGYQLSLGGSDGFAGFDPGFYSGQARVYGLLEQRYFPNLEIATLMPVLAVFGSVGETAWKVSDINRKDLVYVAGIGLRFAQTKSISRLINKIDISFPINGVRKGEPHYSATTTLSL